MLPGITKREDPSSALSVETPLAGWARGRAGLDDHIRHHGRLDERSVNHGLFRPGAGHSRVTGIYEFDKKQRRSLEASEKKKKLRALRNAEPWTYLCNVCRELFDLLLLGSPIRESGLSMPCVQLIEGGDYICATRTREHLRDGKTHRQKIELLVIRNVRKASMKRGLRKGRGRYVFKDGDSFR